MQVWVPIISKKITMGASRTVFLSKKEIKTWTTRITYRIFLHTKTQVLVLEKLLSFPQPKSLK
jgi:hypothetical protein